MLSSRPVLSGGSGGCASGCGKSSLVKACLFSALDSGRSHGLTPYYELTKSGPDDDPTWKCDVIPNATGCYRLPSEAEWEYACRAASQTQYAFGDEEDHLDDYGYYDRNSGRQTSAAGNKLPNGWGLFDMHGNVWEWCYDWHDGDYYAGSPSVDPSGPGTGSYRVYRGGCWSLQSEFCRSAYRFRGTPDFRLRDLGFRVARSPPGGQSVPGPVK